MLSFDRRFTIRIPDRNNWKSPQVPNKEKLAFYTNGSKMSVQELVFTVKGINHSFKKNKDYRVFQGEITAIIQAAKAIRKVRTVNYCTHRQLSTC